MAIKFNPLTGNFDFTGSGGGGGGSSYIDGEVQNFSALPQTIGSPAVDSAYLVREAEGAWLLARKPAGIYIRTANTGVRADDWTHASAFPDVFSDAAFTVYSDLDATANVQLDLSGISAATTRTLTVPDASGTLGWLQSVSSITVSTDHQLTAARNQRVLVNSTGGGSGTAVYLPATGNAEGDRLEVACVGLTSGVLSVRTGQYDFTVSTSMGLNEQRTFIYTSGAWTVGTVESHTHTGLGPTFTTAAFRLTESPYQLAFSLSGLTGTRTLTAPDASGRIQIEGQAIGNTTPAAGNFTTLVATPPAGSSALTLTGGTVTANNPALNVSQTWNNSGVAFRAFSLDVTTTAAPATAMLAEFLHNGTSRFRFTPAGTLDVTTDGGFNSGSAGINIGNGGSFRMNNQIELHTATGGILEQRRTTNPQEFRLYNVYGSTTAYHRLSIKSKTVTLSGLTGASVATTGGFIPDGAVLVGLTTKVSTAITGATGYDIGDGSDADRWGANVAIALNTSSDNRDWTAGTIECFTAAQEVTLTAVGSNFTGGAVVIVAHYLAGEAD
jgi:hypothetical protein